MSEPAATRPLTPPSRVPVVRQRIRTECGVACLAMVLQAHRLPASLDACRRRLPPGRDGVNAADLSAVAREMGLRVRAFSAHGRGAVDALPLPAIVHWKPHHYVVLEARRRRSVTVVDPEKGRRRLSWERFLEQHSGIALTFEPNPETADRSVEEPGARTWRLLRWPGLRPVRLPLLALGFLVHLLGVAAALGAAAMVEVQPTVPRGGVGFLLLAWFLLGTARSRLLLSFRARLDRILADPAFRDLLALPAALADPRGLGDATALLLIRVRGAFAQRAVRVALDAPALLLCPVALLVLSPAAALAALLAAAVATALVLIPRPRLVALPAGELAGRVEPTARALDLLEALTGSGGPSHRSAWVDPAVGATGGAGLLAVLWIGVQEMLQGRVPAGVVLATVALAAQLLAVLPGILDSWQRLRSLGPHVDLLDAALDRRDDS